jgi:hypothetical protein
MPSRAASYKIPSPALQGDDSWVVMKNITVDEFRKHQALVLEAGKTPANTPEGNAIEKKTHESLMDKVLDWNWVDNDGAPLPKPHNNVAVVEKLTIDEINFLTGLIMLGGGEKKVMIPSTPKS